MQHWKTWSPLGEQMANMLDCRHVPSSPSVRKRFHDPQRPEPAAAKPGSSEHRRGAARLSDRLRSVPNGERPGSQRAFYPGTCAGMETALEVAVITVPNFAGMGRPKP